MPRVPRALGLDGISWEKTAMRDVKIAVGQWPVVDSRDANLKSAERFLRQAADAGAGFRDHARDVPDAV